MFVIKNVNTNTAMVVKENCKKYDNDPDFIRVSKSQFLRLFNEASRPFCSEKFKKLSVGMFVFDTHNELKKEEIE